MSNVIYIYINKLSLHRITYLWVSQHDNMLKAWQHVSRYGAYFYNIINNHVLKMYGYFLINNLYW